MFPLPCRLSNLAISATSISYRKELSKAKPWMTPALIAGRGRSVQVRRYLIYAVPGKQLPVFAAARSVLIRLLFQVSFDLRGLVTLGANGKGGFLLEVPEELTAERAIIAFLEDLAQLTA